MAEVYEPVQLIVDNLILSGLEANLASTNAVSKAYVDGHITTAVANLVNSAPATLDTLKEIATALGNDANLATTLANSISGEVTARSLADAGLQTQINALSVSTGGSGGSSLQSQITAEISARTSAVSAEATRAMAVESKEAFDRATNENGLQSQITALSGSTATSVSSLQSQIYSEGNSRTSALSDIRIDLNEGNRILDERLSSLSMNLENETTDRSVADMGLSSRCDDLHVSILNEQTERKSNDNDLRQYIDAEVNERLTQKEIFLQYRREDSDARDIADALKLDKAGGIVTGDVTLVDSYLNFGSNWRVKASGDGSKIVFQHKKADNVWRTAIPFICAV
jgi:hypothetical protein